MQLSTLVLPAPFGPIKANSSPGATANEMPSSATRPPNRSVSPLISISAIPSPAAAILFDGAIAASVARCLAEIELLDIAVRQQSCTIAVEHDSSVLENIAIVGDLERYRSALLDDDNGDPELRANLHEPHGQVFDHHRGQTKRQLVDQQQLRLAHERARDREHLSLAAGQEARKAAAQVGEAGEELKRCLLAAPPVGAAEPDRGAQVFRHREIWKYLVSLRHQHDAAARDLMRRPVVDPLALERDRSFGHARVVDAEKARDRAQRRGLARAIGAEDRNDLTRLDG